MPALEQFISGLDHVPWFKRSGQPSPRDQEVLRIYAWDVWPGPEDPAAMIQAAYHMRWRTELFQTETLPVGDLMTRHWERIHAIVFDLVRANVPYRDEQDAWYAPNAAVWQAAWIAALVGCTLFKYGQLPERSPSQWTLASEWSWFQEGHWPCCYFWSWGYTELDAVERTGGPRRLIVY